MGCGIVEETVEFVHAGWGGKSLIDQGWEGTFKLALIRIFSRARTERDLDDKGGPLFDLVTEIREDLVSDTSVNSLAQYKAGERRATFQENAGTSNHSTLSKCIYDMAKTSIFAPHPPFTPSLSARETLIPKSIDK